MTETVNQLFKLKTLTFNSQRTNQQVISDRFFIIVLFIHIFFLLISLSIYPKEIIVFNVLYFRIIKQRKTTNPYI